MCLRTLRRSCRAFQPAWRSSRDVLALSEPRRQLLEAEAVGEAERTFTVAMAISSGIAGHNDDMHTNLSHLSRAALKDPLRCYMDMIQHLQTA